ncbi:MAG: nucleotidyltransferase [Deltaproteobacteria bacterium]|nr:nucleotidyltransferase [Deltaproteobacteria bacterium]
MKWITLLIGVMLVIAYGIPRVSKDIDLFIKATQKNTEKLLKALKEAGIGTASLTTAKEISDHEITVFKDYLRVDILTKVKGLDFEKAYQSRDFLEMDGLLIPALNYQDLLKSKKSAGRPRDLEDIKELEKVKKILEANKSL